MELKVIANIRTDFSEKFGLPRQSGIVPGLTGRIIFTEKYRCAAALRELDGYSHIWLIWGFSLPFSSSSDSNNATSWSPTVRPPRLGGNTRVGVFATRSPNRPNPLGLSCVKLEKIEYSGADKPVIVVSGIDMADMTPIYDIKPYLPHIDSIPDAKGGFAAAAEGVRLDVLCGKEMLDFLPRPLREPLLELLAQDPRPSYQRDNERIFGFGYAGFEVKFTSDGKCITVLSIEKI